MEEGECLDAAATQAAERCLGAAAERALSPQEEVVLRYEDRAEEWHFDEGIHKSQLLEHRSLSEALRERERKAREQQAKDVEDHERRIAALLATAEAEERKCALEVAGLREELIDAEDCTGCDEEETVRKVVALDQEMRAERERRAALEQEMAAVHEEVVKATQQITEIQDHEEEQMRKKRTRMAERRVESKRECAETQREADLQIQAIGKRTREEIDRISQLITEKMKETQSMCDVEVQNRRNVARDTEVHVKLAVDSKVDAGLADVQMKIMEEREQSLMQIKDLQVLNHQQEDFLRKRMDDAFESVQTSIRERDEIAMLEKYHKRQLESAFDILGCSLPGNRHSLTNKSRSLRNTGALMLGAQ